MPGSAGARSVVLPPADGRLDISCQRSADFASVPLSILGSHEGSDLQGAGAAVTGRRGTDDLAA